MFPGTLPRPLLSLIFEPVANIEYLDEDALGSLWSVFTKVSDAISHGKRLENMTWRLWHRAYSRRAVLLSPRPTAAGNSSDLRVVRALPLSPSLSFSSSSEVTTSSSDWDHDTAVNDDEEAISNRNINGDTQSTSVIAPSLQNGKLAFHTSPTATSSAPVASTFISQRRSLNQSNDTREMPARVPFTLHSHQDIDKGFHSNNTQNLAHPSPVLHLVPFDLSRNTTGHDPSAPIASPSPRSTLSRKDFDGSADDIVPVKMSRTPDSNASVCVPPEPLTVGKLISRMLAEKISLTKPLPRLTIDNTMILHSDDPCSSPKIEIVAPSDSPALNATSTLTSAASTPRQSCPTVIVVNPTPHPTPPATPSIEPPEKSFNLSPRPVTAIHTPRLALQPDVTGSSLSPSSYSNNDQLATPVSIGKRSVSNNNHVTCDVPQIFDQQSPASTAILTSIPFTTSSSNSSSLKRASGASNSITLPERPVGSGEIASHLPTPAAELTPDMSASRATTTPIDAPAPALSEDKKFFLAVPHNGSGGSGHDSTESPDSLGTSSINSRRRDTARGSPLIDSHAHPKPSFRLEEELSSSFSASSPAGRPQSITSSKGDSIASKTKPRATFMVSSGTGRRKASSKKSVKNLYKKESEKRVSSIEYEPVGDESFKGKGVVRRERDVLTLTQPSTPPKTDTAAAHFPRVKTMHQHLSFLNQNTQTSLRQLPTNPPRRPVSLSLSPSNNGVRPDISHGNTQPLQPNVQLVGQLGLGLLPPSKESRHLTQVVETSSEYSTTDTEEDDSCNWESESGSAEEKKEKPSNERHLKSRRSVSSKNERMQYHNHNNGNRQRDPGESVRDAALEAQRQLDMFQKLPPRTYSNLSHLPRTKSGLSLLFRPDPELFPVGHPYRTSRSSQDLLARNWSTPAPPLAMTAIHQRATPVAPVEASVTVSSLKANLKLDDSLDELTGRPSATQAQRGGGNYRSRAKPVDQEEESDSDDNEVPVPNSVAERRLAAIARQGSRSGAHSPSARQKLRNIPNPQTASHVQADSYQPIPRTNTMPILPHQFLPEPAPLQMPHEIRRRIISEELDEELRRNLLWERSQNQMPGRPARLNGSILPGPWRTPTPFRPPVPEANMPTDSQSQTRLFSTQRTKSWAGEYHATGW